MIHKVFFHNAYFVPSILLRKGVIIQLGEHQPRSNHLRISLCGNFWVSGKRCGVIQEKCFFCYYLSLWDIFVPCWSTHWPLTSEENKQDTAIMVWQFWFTSVTTRIREPKRGQETLPSITGEVRHFPLQKAEANLFKYKQNVITYLVISVSAGAAGIRFKQINYLHRLCLWFAMDLWKPSWQGLKEVCLWLT